METSNSEQLNVLQEAARQGDPVAAYNLGVISEDADCLEEAKRWYRMAAEAGDPDAATNLANLLINEAERTMDEAHRWLTEHPFAAAAAILWRRLRPSISRIRQIPMVPSRAL